MRLYRCKANGDGSEAAAASPATSRPDEQEMAEVSRTTDDARPFYSATCPRSAEPDSTTTTPDSSQSNTVADEADLERGDEATSSEADGCMKQLTREQHIVVSVIVGIPLMLLFGYFFWMYGAMVNFLHPWELRKTTDVLFRSLVTSCTRYSSSSLGHFD